MSKDKFNVEKVIDVLVEKVGWGRDSFASTTVRDALQGKDLDEFKAYEWRIDHEVGSGTAIAYGPGLAGGTLSDPRMSIYFNNSSSSDTARSQLKRLMEHLNATDFKP